MTYPTSYANQSLAGAAGTALSTLGFTVQGTAPYLTDGLGGVYSSSGSNAVGVNYYTTKPTSTNFAVTFSIYFASASSASNHAGWLRLRANNATNSGYDVGYRHDSSVLQQFEVRSVKNGTYDGNDISSLAVTYAAGTTVNLRAEVTTVAGATKIRLFRDLGDGFKWELVFEYTDSSSPILGTESGGGYWAVCYYYANTVSTGFHITGPIVVDNSLSYATVNGAYNPNDAVDQTRPDLSYYFDFQRELQTAPDGVTPFNFTPGIDGMVTGAENAATSYSRVTVNSTGAILGSSSTSGSSDSLTFPSEGRINWNNFSHNITLQCNGQTWATYGNGVNPPAEILYYGDQFIHLIAYVSGNYLFAFLYDYTVTPSYAQSRVFDTTQAAFLTSAFASNTPVTLTFARQTTTLKLAVNGVHVPWYTGTHPLGGSFGSGPWTDLPATSASSSCSFRADGFVWGTADAAGGFSTTTYQQPTGLTYIKAWGFSDARVIGQVQPSASPTAITANTSTNLGTVNKLLGGAVKTPYNTATNAKVLPGLSGSVLRLPIAMVGIDVASTSSGTRTVLGASSGLYIDPRPLQTMLDHCLACVGTTGQGYINFIGNLAAGAGTGGATYSVSSNGAADWGSPDNTNKCTSTTIYNNVCKDFWAILSTYATSIGLTLSSYVGLDNEYDPGSPYTLAQWAPRYNTWSIAMHSLGLKCGAEFASVVADASWVNDATNGIFAYNKAHSGYVDFVNIHAYTGSENEILQSMRIVHEAINTTSWGATVKIGIGEGMIGIGSYWLANSAAHTGTYPYAQTVTDITGTSRTLNYQRNAMAGSQLAGELMFVESLTAATPFSNISGVWCAVRTFSECGTGGDQYYDTAGDYDSSGGHLTIAATVHQMRAKIPANSTIFWCPSHEIAPGVRGAGYLDPTGVAWVWLSYSIHGVNRSPARAINLTLSGVTAGTQAQRWIAGWDGTQYRSDYQDGGSTHEQLENSTAVGVDANGVLSVILQPQSVQLIKISNLSTVGRLSSNGGFIQ